MIKCLNKDTGKLNELETFLSEFRDEKYSKYPNEMKCTLCTEYPIFGNEMCYLVYPDVYCMFIKYTKHNHFPVVSYFR
jgi:hypothetical protein